MNKLWKRYLDLLDKDLNTKIFDNLKNLVFCALLFAVGAEAMRRDHQLFFSIWASSTAGWGLIIMSGVLMIMNISDGVRRLSKVPYHTFWQILIIVFYVLIAERMVELVWTFRVGD